MDQTIPSHLNRAEIHWMGRSGYSGRGCQWTCAEPKMTIVEFFPWLLAICVTLISVAIMRESRVPSEWSLGFGLALGVASLLLYVFGGRSLLSRLDKRQTERMKSEKARRVYQPFDLKESFPAGDHLYYECLVCGNTLPSVVKKQVSCKCRNIAINATGDPTIQNQKRVKVFSVSE